MLIWETKCYKFAIGSAETLGSYNKELPFGNTWNHILLTISSIILQSEKLFIILTTQSSNKHIHSKYNASLQEFWNKYSKKTEDIPAIIYIQNSVI